VLEAAQSKKHSDKGRRRDMDFIDGLDAKVL
jgi:hypothetical protein